MGSGLSKIQIQYAAAAEDSARGEIQVTFHRRAVSAVNKDVHYVLHRHAEPQSNHSCTIPRPASIRTAARTASSALAWRSS